MLPRPKDVPQPHAYISEPLTGRPDIEAIKAYCHQIATVCEEAGLYPYLPFMHSDPILHKDVTAREIFDADKAMTQGAAAVVFYLPGDPAGSFGVGGEMVFAAAANRPMAMMIRQPTTLSAFERGFIDIEVTEARRGPVIEFDSNTEAQALASLAQFLQRLPKSIFLQS